MCSTPLSPADEIDRRSHLQQRIIRRLNALDPWNRVVDDLLLFQCIVWNHSPHLDGPQLHQLSTFRPVHRRIVDLVSFLGKLGHDVEYDFFPGYALLDLIVEKTGTFLFDSAVVEMVLASGGEDAIAEICAFAIGGDEFERVDSIVGFSCETRGRGLWRLHKCQSGWVRAQELFSGRWRRRSWR